MKKTWLRWTVLGAPALIAAGCATYPDRATTRQIAEKMVSEEKLDAVIVKEENI